MQSYDGPLAMGRDFLTVNVRPGGDIRVRDTVPILMPDQVMDDGRYVREQDGEPDVSRKDPAPISEWLAKGRVDFGDAGLPGGGEGVVGLAFKAAFNVLSAEYPDGITVEEIEKSIEKQKAALGEKQGETEVKTE